MNIPIGTVLYRYTIKNKTLFIREGVVDSYGLRTCVNFRDGSTAVRCPRAEDIGVIRTVGHSLWLEERDDKLAVSKFIAYEEQKVAELQKSLEYKLETIEYLKGMKVENYEV